MSSAVVVEILLGLLTAIVGIVTYIAASNANRMQAKVSMIAVDAAAYERAQEIYESALASLRTDLANMREESERLRASNEQLRQEVFALRMEIGKLRGGLSNGKS